VAKIHRYNDVLNREIDAIKAGDLDVVSAIFEEKSRAAEMVGTVKTPAGRAFYSDHPIMTELGGQAHLKHPQSAIERKTSAIVVLAWRVAARTILREVKKDQQSQ